MQARTFVSPSLLNHNEVRGKLRQRFDATSRGEVDEQSATGGECLLTNEHSVWSADHIRHDPDRDTCEAKAPHGAVIAGPLPYVPEVARRSDIAHDVPVRVEHDDRRNVAGREIELPASLSDQLLRLEQRVLLIGLGPEQRWCRSTISRGIHVDTLPRPLLSRFSGGFFASIANRSA